MANEKYALLDTDFISKMHLIRKDDQNKLIDKIMTMPNYTFYWHKQIGIELTRHNIAGSPEWFSAKVADKSINLYDDEMIMDELSEIYGQFAIASYAKMVQVACDAYSEGYFEENFNGISQLDYSTVSKEEFLTQLEADCDAIGEGQNLGELKSYVLLQTLNMKFELPSLSQQKRIVDVIAPIDKKIHKNAIINDYLEEMAKTIYDYWFVQFDFPNENGKPYKSSGGKMVNSNGHIIPESWTFCKVQDIISNICTGLNPRDNFKLGTGDIKYITVKNLTPNGTLDFTGCDTIDESARTIVHNRSDIQIGDILFASIAPLGRCYLIQSEPTDWDINESVFSIRANTDIITPAFLYLYFMSDAFIKHATSSSTGSIFKGIRINTLLETELCVPLLSVILKFEERLASIFPLKSKNYEEIQRLSNLRDWLLPMLMNGQATIED